MTQKKQSHAYHHGGVSRATTHHSHQQRSFPKATGYQQAHWQQAQPFPSRFLKENSNHHWCMYLVALITLGAVGLFGVKAEIGLLVASWFTLRGAALSTLGGDDGLQGFEVSCMGEFVCCFDCCDLLI